MTDDTTATGWLRTQATRFVLPEIEKVEKVMLDHFGTAEKASRMVSLFPDRYLIATRGEDGFFGGLFGGTYEGRVLTSKYTLIDKLAPKEKPDGR